MPIQWYPGHMAKARREIVENLKLVDCVIELVDARAPWSSRNPDIMEIQRKPVVLLCTKDDLADSKCTREWLDFWHSRNQQAIAIDLLHAKSIAPLFRAIRAATPRASRAPRALVVGIPNVGKSSLINRLVGKSSARVGAKPGVTRGKQWIRAKDYHFLDTPGVLWPKFSSEEVGYRLAAIGSVKDEIFEWEEIGLWLLNFLKGNYWENLNQRYGLEDGDDLLQQVGRRLGTLRSGGVVDLRQAAYGLIRDFRQGKLGTITLEVPVHPEREGRDYHGDDKAGRDVPSCARIPTNSRD